MAVGALVFIGQFTAWTYITPFLMDQTHLSSGVISILYVIYGCGGIVGSVVAGSLFKRGVIASFAGAATVVAALLIKIPIVRCCFVRLPLKFLTAVEGGCQKTPRVTTLSANGCAKARSKTTHRRRNSSPWTSNRKKPPWLARPLGN